MILKLAQHDPQRELEFEIDYLLSLTTQQRFEMMLQEIKRDEADTSTSCASEGRGFRKFMLYSHIRRSTFPVRTSHLRECF